MKNNPMVDRLMRSIESNPLDLRGYYGLAEEYQSAGEYRRGKLALSRAIEIEPLCPESWRRLGHLHGAEGDWRSCADAFERACELAPQDAASWGMYGTALISTHDIRQASHACSVLLRQFPDRCDGHMLAGHLSKIMGKTADAVEHYRRVLQIDHRRTEAIFNLVDVSPPGPSEHFTRQLEALRKDPSLSDKDSVNLCFALARIYDAAGLVDAAFPLFQEANGALSAMMRRLGHSYDPLRHESDAHRIIEMFTPAVSAHPLEPLDIGIKMIFIVGLPRSGTTLVERILSGHPRVVSGGELPFLPQYLTALIAAGNSAGRERGGLDTPAARQLLVRLREQYMDCLFERELDGEYVIDKLPANFLALGLARMLFPDALIIHCIREPIATCWSLYTAHLGTHLAYYTSFEHLVHYCKKVYGRLMAHWREVPGTAIIHLEYESLASNPRQAIHALLEQCGLEWNEGCLHVDANTQPIFTASAQQARRPIHGGSVARWQKYEKFLAPLLRELGETR